MPYYHLKLRCQEQQSRILRKLGDPGIIIVYQFFDLKEAEVTMFRKLMDKDVEFWFHGKMVHPKHVRGLSVFKTKKDFSELLQIFNGDKASVRDGILDGKIAETVTSLYFDYPILMENKNYTVNDLVKSVQSLGLNKNWFTATCALQLQEVVITIVSEKMGIILNKLNVERILETTIEGEPSFNLKYQAFSKEVKERNVDMPLIYEDMRTTRRKVLHLGKNPTSEDVDTIMTFTIGLCEKLSQVIDLCG